MQPQAAEGPQLGRGGHDAARRAVARIANDGMAGSGEVDANLVRASGVETGFEEGESGASGAIAVRAGSPESRPEGSGFGTGARATWGGRGHFVGGQAQEDAPGGECGASSLGSGRQAGGHAGAAAQVACNGQVDAAGIVFDAAVDERQIGLFDLPGSKEASQAAVGVVVPSDEEDSGSVFVKPVDDARPCGSAEGGQAAEAQGEGVGDGAGGEAGSGMDGEAGRLIHGDEIVIFVEEIERNGFGRGDERSRGDELDLDGFARLEAMAWARGGAADPNVASSDFLLDARPAHLRQAIGQPAIQALAGVIRACLEAANARGRFSHAATIAQRRAGAAATAGSFAERFLRNNQEPNRIIPRLTNCMKETAPPNIIPRPGSFRTNSMSPRSTP